MRARSDGQQQRVLPDRPDLILLERNTAGQAVVVTHDEALPACTERVIRRLDGRVVAGH